MSNITHTVREYKLTRQEGLYHANVHANVTASGGTLNLHLENPADSGVRVVITDVKITSKGPTTISVPHGFTLDTTGTARTADNNAIGSSNTATANVYEDSTYSSVDHTHEEYVGSGGTGQGNRPPTGGPGSDIGSVLEEGQDYVVEVTNDDTSNAHDMSITVEFYETTPTQA